jgi:prepilin-type N-terminal cleavage/methylation domain-containing protein
MLSDFSGPPVLHAAIHHRRARCRTRAGFTLIELLVALVLTGIVALLVYGAAQAGMDVEERLATRRRPAQSARGMRVLLQDALHNVLPAIRPDDSTFVLESRHDARGRPLDRLVFQTGSDLPPLSGEANWLLTLEPTPAGLTLTARPIGTRSAARVLGVLPDITGLRVRVLGTDSSGRWDERWAYPAIMPRGVELTYWTAAGAVDPPLRVALPLGARSAP